MDLVPPRGRLVRWGFLTDWGGFLVELLTSHQDHFAFEVEMHDCNGCVFSVCVYSCELSRFLSSLMSIEARQKLRKS
jgi:hypothetical protein